MTYALLLAPPLVAAGVAVAVALRTRRRAWAALAMAAVMLLALTIVFDSVMIAADLFRYDDALLLGPRIGLAPIEDLAYALIALGVVATLWRLLPSRIRSSAPAPGRAQRAARRREGPPEPADA